MKQPGSRRRRLNVSGPAAALLVAAAILPQTGLRASAGDWSLESRLTGRAEFDDNYELVANPKGWVFVSTEDIYSDFIYTGKTSRLDLIADIVAQQFEGPGSADLENNVFPSLGVKYLKTGKRTDFAADAGFSVQQLSATEQIDNGISIVETTSNTIKTSYSTDASLTHRFDLRNALVLSAAAAQTTYQGAGDNNTDLNASLAYKRRLTKVTDGALTFGFEDLKLEDDANTDRRIYGVNASVAAKLNNRLNVDFGAGVNVVDSHQTEIAPGGTSRTSDTVIGYAFNADLGYTLKSTTIRLGAGYGLSPSSLGDLQNEARVFAEVGHQINERSAISLSTGVESVSAISGGGDDNFDGFYISPTYTFALTEKWSLQAGYRYLLKRTKEDTLTSNNVFLSLTGPLLTVR